MKSNTTSSLAPGTILHGEVYNYKITKVLGQGSYGITYLAETVNSNEATCLVAIKELFIREACTRTGTTVNTGNAGTDFAYFKQKFEKEALHIKTLNHPNIVRSAETFKANNTVYFVMEFINGESLSNRIARLGRLSESEALDITRQIGAALRHMHAHNMLHLDVKPDNIMMRGNEAVLVDFGLSKQYDRNGKAMTMTLITSGTNGYAPMEQFSYREHNGFPATLDIHALGATLFKMLTGYGNMQDLVFEIDEEGFPSQKLLAFNVSAHIVAVIEKAMAHLARNRYQSIDEMLKALDTQTIQNHQSNEATTFASSNNSFSYKKELDEEEEIEEEENLDEQELMVKEYLENYDNENCLPIPKGGDKLYITKQDGDVVYYITIDFTNVDEDDDDPLYCRCGLTIIAREKESLVSEIGGLIKMMFGGKDKKRHRLTDPSDYILYLDVIRMFIITEMLKKGGWNDINNSNTPNYEHDHIDINYKKKGLVSMKTSLANDCGMVDSILNNGELKKKMDEAVKKLRKEMK